MNESTKLAIVGLSKAGKTSIYRRCFERHNIKDIEKTPPTIMIAQNIVNLGHISQGIGIWDFGGQKTFRDTYLKNPSYFNQTKIILFVVDVLNSEDFSEEKQYFSSILQIFQDPKNIDIKELPKMFVFLHKCDPDKKEVINEKIVKSLIEMTSLFGNEVPYFLTSIYDDSACKSLNNILFFSLPEEIIEQIFSKGFIVDLKKSITKKIKNKSTIELTEISKLYGELIGKKILDLWINSPLNRVDKDLDGNEAMKKIKIIYKENNQKSFKLKCPFSTEDTNCPEDNCTMVFGFIAGILNSLNLSNRSLEINQIKENGECFFTF